MALPEIPENLQNLAKLQEFLKALRDALLVTIPTGVILPDGSQPFTGDQSMGGHKITNLGAPTAGGDATNKTYVDTQEALDLRLNGSRTMTGALNMGTHKINNVVDPTALQDAATKNYVDSLSGGNTPGFDIAAVALTTGVAFTGNKVNGTTINFTTGRTGVTFFSTSAYISGNHPLPSDSLGINVDGTDYTLGVFAINNGSGGDTVFDVPFGGSIGISLAPGNHVAYVIATQVNIGFVAAPGSPLTLSVIFPTVNGQIGAASPLVFQEAENITGVATGNATTTYALIPGTLISINLPSAQVVHFIGLATIGLSGSYNAQLGVRIDGVDYNGTGTRTSSSSANDRNGEVISKAVQLAAGVHTAQLVLRQAIAAAGNAEALNTVDLPTRLTAIYTAAEALTPAAAASITTQEAENVTNVITSVTGGVTVLVPGTLINIVLPSTQVVLLNGLAGLLNSDGGDPNGFNGQLGVRVDGADYFGVPAAWESIYIHFGAPITVSKSVTLGPGAHTAQLIFRQAQMFNNREGRLANGVNNSLIGAPSRLTAIYTTPQAITPLTEVVVESDSASDSTASTTLVATAATVTFSLTTSSVVKASALTTAVAGGGGNQYQATNIALKVDGTTYTTQSVESFGNSVGPQLVPMMVLKDIVLAPGSHTITLMFAKRANGSGANGALQNTHLSVVYHA